MTLLLALKDVTVLRAGRPVLAEAGLTLHAGERLAVIGPNGAGKTTLLRTLVGLETPTGGTVTAFGEDRRGEASFRAVRLKAGFLFQDADDQLFAPTVIEDVAFGPLNLGLTQRDALAKARAALDRLGLSGYEDRVTHRLSGGEKRLVALAGILAMDPEVLLLDEPTNALDCAYRARLMEILVGLDAAMVIVSHDMDFLERLATRALVLSKGRLKAATMHRHVHTHDHIHVHTVPGDD